MKSNFVFRSNYCAFSIPGFWIKLITFKQTPQLTSPQLILDYKMAGKGKGTRSGKKQVTSSAKAGVIFPVARCNRKFKEGRFAYRVSASAGAFAAAVLEYLTCEILELAGNACSEAGRKTIAPRHMQLAFGNDDELNKLMVDSTLSQGGVMPNIQAELWPRKGKKGTAAGTQEI